MTNKNRWYGHWRNDDFILRSVDRLKHNSELSRFFCCSFVYYWKREKIDYLVMFPISFFSVSLFINNTTWKSVMTEESHCYQLKCESDGKNKTAGRESRDPIVLSWLFFNGGLPGFGNKKDRFFTKYIYNIIYNNIIRVTTVTSSIHRNHLALTRLFISHLAVNL